MAGSFLNIDVAPDGPVDATSLMNHADLSLQQAWAGHHRPDDVIDLWDMESADYEPSMREGAPSGPPVPTTRRDGSRTTFVPLVQPARFLDMLSKNGFRETVRELRGVRDDARALGITLVPVLVRFKGGTWATRWSPHGDVIHIGE